MDAWFVLPALALAVGLVAPAGVQSQAAAAASIIASASAAPSGPVAALAQPEFTTRTLQ